MTSEFLSWLATLTSDPNLALLSYLNDPYSQQVSRGMSGMRMPMLRDEYEMARMLATIRGIDPRTALGARTVSNIPNDPFAPIRQGPTANIGGFTVPINTSGIPNNPVIPSRGATVGTVNDPRVPMRTAQQPITVPRTVGGIFPIELVEYLQQINPQGQMPTRRLY